MVAERLPRFQRLVVNYNDKNIVLVNKNNSCTGRVWFALMTQVNLLAFRDPLLSL